MGVECFRVLFPKGMDANEYSLKVQPAAKSLGVLLNKAEWLGKGKRPEPRSVEPMMELVMDAEPVIEPEPAAVKPQLKNKSSTNRCRSQRQSHRQTASIRRTIPTPKPEREFFL